MKIVKNLNDYPGLSTEKPRQRTIKDNRSGGLIYTTVKSDIDYLDHDLIKAIIPWIKEGKYLKEIMVITDIQDWADFKVIERIKKILNTQFSHIEGTFHIQDLEDQINIIYTKD